MPEQVEAAVEKALEKLPADRWETAHEFAEALAGASAPDASTPSPRPVASTGAKSTVATASMRS